MSVDWGELLFLLLVVRVNYLVRACVKCSRLHSLLISFLIIIFERPLVSVVALSWVLVQNLCYSRDGPLGSIVVS